MEQIKEYAVMILFGAFLFVGYQAYLKEYKLDIPAGYKLIKIKDIQKINTKIQLINESKNKPFKFYE